LVTRTFLGDRGQQALRVDGAEQVDGLGEHLPGSPGDEAVGFGCERGASCPAARRT